MGDEQAQTVRLQRCGCLVELEVLKGVLLEGCVVDPSNVLLEDPLVDAGCSFEGGLPQISAEALVEGLLVIVAGQAEQL